MAALAGLHGSDDSVRARRVAEREAYVRELDAQVRLPCGSSSFVPARALSVATCAMERLITMLLQVMFIYISQYQTG